MSEMRNFGQLIVIDDDPMQAAIVRGITGGQVLAIESLKNLSTVLEQCEATAFLVDIHLGLDENGLDALPKIKKACPFAPIIVMTGTTNDTAVGEALASGAHDFIYKPFRAGELLGRLQARLNELLSRAKRDVISIGDLRIDLVHKSLSNDLGHIRYLSATDMSILQTLLDAQGTVVRREDIKRRCWGPIFVSDNALNRKLHEVRQALKEISAQVRTRTVYGMGFCLEVNKKKQAEKSA